MLKGEFEYTLDDKGRVVIPPRFRRQIGDRFVVTRGFDGCVVLYPESEWAGVEDKLRGEPLANRQFVRYLLGSAVEVETDRQGRFVLPPPLREHAGIQRDVVVVGLINKLEIWSRERWQQYLKQTVQDESRLIEGMKELNL
ncbi:MAG: division/cell wall cluster transcriptional repressor MraZ [Armatimonadota bacterium]|nr:division/cell wall cluster transcriptional repressor MraZ [Armatimonadota bacterium]MDR5696670.1 division/cell wall cluster transcriptional repressor MraZ [Armatimonadota bacterium]